MTTYNQGKDNAAYKTGARIKGEGVRLGWITKDMHSQIVAQLQPGQTMTDWVIAAIETALREEEK